MIKTSDTQGIGAVLQANVLPRGIAVVVTPAATFAAAQEGVLGAIGVSDGNGGVQTAGVVDILLDEDCNPGDLLEWGPDGWEVLSQPIAIGEIIGAQALEAGLEGELVKAYWTGFPGFKEPSEATSLTLVESPILTGGETITSFGEIRLVNGVNPGPGQTISIAANPPPGSQIAFSVNNPPNGIFNLDPLSTNLIQDPSNGLFAMAVALPNTLYIQYIYTASRGWALQSFVPGP